MKKQIDINGFSVNLPQNSQLPHIKKNCKMYDGILPFLADINTKKWIIDIGSNVGDTVAAMLKNTEAHFLCVEPSEYFFDIMQGNFAKWDSKYTNRITAVNCFISNVDTDAYSLIEKNGTASVKVLKNKEGAVKTYTLDNLVNKIGIVNEDIGLIKIDTDGFDANCILSAERIINEAKPILYWENQIETEEQLNMYTDMINNLQNKGYKSFFLFDNYGNYLSEFSEEQVYDMVMYLWRIHNGLSYRTFYYYDIIACENDEDILKVKNGIRRFVSK